jgi:hypothetical protein
MKHPQEFAGRSGKTPQKTDIFARSGATEILMCQIRS